MIHRTRLRLGVYVACAGLCVCSRLGAQSLVLTVTNAPTPGLVNSNLTYTIDVTNLSGIGFTEVVVTNTLPATAPFVSASSSVGVISTNGQIVIFGPLQLPPFGGAEMTVVGRPTVAGIITNLVSASSSLFGTGVSTQLVTRVILPEAGVSVALSSPPGPVYINDWTTYQVSVTNHGPSAASAVIVSNELPAGAQFISVLPADQTLAVTNGSVSLGLGALAKGQSQTFTLRLQPTIAGVLTFSSTVSVAGVTNASSNQTASATLVVSPFLSGVLIASNASAMNYNPQTGLMEQTIALANVGTSTVASARVMISGLTNLLYNAVGTNNGDPFVVYGSGLDPGHAVDLGLEYFVPTRLPITVPDSAYRAVEVLTNAPAAPLGTPFNVTLVTNLPSGFILIEFQSIPGRSYTIQYSDTASFTNARVAQPPITAPADRVQWIDDGPPKTISPPPSAASRFYRVLLNP